MKKDIIIRENRKIISFITNISVYHWCRQIIVFVRCLLGYSFISISSDRKKSRIILTNKYACDKTNDKQQGVIKRLILIEIDHLLLSIFTKID